MSPPPYACWASADEWRPGYVMLGANVNAIPAPPGSVIIIGSDGLWGAHEWTVYPQPYCPKFPYLPWIHLRSPNPSTPSNILTRPVEKTMWRSHGHRTDAHVVTPALLDELTKEWETIKSSVQKPFQTMSSLPSFSSVECPMEAYFRAATALNRLGDDFEAWRDFAEVYRNLQRSLLELSAFLDWWKDVSAGSNFQPYIRPPTRGAIFEDERLYAEHAHYSVGAFLLVHKTTFTLDLAKKVGLSPRNLCKERPMSLNPIVHSLQLWYYPPQVEDVMDLETAARGYAGRLDTFKPTKAFKRKLDKVENKMNDQSKLTYWIIFLTLTNGLCIVGRAAKMAKTTLAILPNSSNNRELKRVLAAGPGPTWFVKTNEIWKEAVNHVSPSNLVVAETPRRFSLPPIHLFWGGNEENQRIFFYNFFVLHTAIRDRTRKGLKSLTTKEWRSVLGNTYWKRVWVLNRDGNARDNAFDPKKFWRLGGPLFFGDELSAQVAAGECDPTSRLPCGCIVHMETADDSDVRQAALYHLNLLHTAEEIKEMERVQFPSSFEARWKFQFVWVDRITELWDPLGGQPAPGFFHNKTAWRSWLEAVRELVMDWNGFGCWDWSGFSNVRRLDVNKLSTLEFHKFTVRLIAFFIHSFITRLGYFPSPLLCPPTFATHSCCKHRRKFGYDSRIHPL